MSDCFTDSNQKQTYKNLYEFTISLFGDTMRSVQRCKIKHPPPPLSTSQECTQVYLSLISCGADLSGHGLLEVTLYNS